jgi:glycerol-3-phosphate O-acyltransferase/dihydroxyacetone phosphate acyltransferase
VPDEGPVLFVVAPHANQFIDPLLLVMTCGRKVGFLAVYIINKAKKSMDRFWIGLFGRCFNSSRAP